MKSQNPSSSNNLSMNPQLQAFQAAMALHQKGDLVEAKTLYERILEKDPLYFDALHLMGVIHHQNGELAKAQTFFERAMDVRSDFAPRHSHYGLTLKKMNRLKEALDFFNRAISLDSNLSSAHNNRGNVLQDLGEFEAALISYQRAIAIDPSYFPAYVSSGAVLHGLRRFDEALAAYDKVLEANPHHPDARYNKALALLLLGRFEEGLRFYEARKKLGAWTVKLFPENKLWNGDFSNKNKKLLIYGEQGLGDTLQFMRYAHLLAEMGFNVLFAPQKSLKALAASLGSTMEIVDIDDASIQFDCHCPLLSLPLAFNTSLQTIPNATPYITSDKDHVAKWRARIGDHGFKIGICWQGGNSSIDLGRSFALSHFQSISEISDVRLISLHKGEGESQLKNLPDGMVVETLGSDFDSGPHAFIDTAAVMKCCDLVITSDTAIAHLAGVLGVKTWVALKYVPDWRWFLDREDSPWYPTMRLFRQRSAGDWGGVFEAIKSRLLDDMKNSSVR